MCKKIVVDSNILILFLAGVCGGSAIYTHKKLKSFEERHVVELNDILKHYERIVVTPHILTELWNLVGMGQGSWDENRTDLINAACALVDDVIEICHPATSLVSWPDVRWLGLTDVSILAAAHEGFDLISDDSRLCYSAMSRGVTTFHFRQIVDGDL